MTRIGVFVCHCGLNVASTVDVEQVAEVLRDYPGVVVTADHKYLCSDPGQALVREAIQEYALDGVVVAACSPSMHEATFRKAARAAGLNPYRVEIANIREQVSWPHRDAPEAATEKAIEIVRTVVEKVRGDERLTPLTLPIVRRALVVGGGIAGLTAALDIADAGHPVVLVERSDHLGGKMARLSSLYVDLDESEGLLRERIDAALQHPLIEVLTGAEVTAFDGYVGDFRVRIGTTTHAVGAVVLSTGFDLYAKASLPEYGGGRYADVVDGLQFEEMLRTGEIRCPSDGRVPQEVVWVQCAGSRAPERHNSHCSKICCMYVAKQAIAYVAAHLPGERSCTCGSALATAILTPPDAISDEVKERYRSLLEKYL